MQALKRKARILYNRNIKESYFCLGLEAGRVASASQPGQFVNIRLSQGRGSEPLLRRPFSIHKIRAAVSRQRAQIEILYEVVGEATRLLSEKRADECLDVIGPLGKGFAIRRMRNEGGGTILVAGGMGVAPLLYLAERIAYSVERIAYSKPLVLLGAKTKSQILCEKEFKKLGCAVKIATDDGSKGFHGKVTELLRYLLSASRKSGIPPTVIRTAGKGYPLPAKAGSRPPLYGQRENAIYGCGPRPMLKAVAELSKEYRIPAQISLEEHMACGFGVCLGCVVKTRDGYQRVCKEGPVFPAEKIIWE